MLIMSVYGTWKYALKTVLYVAIGGTALIIRHHNRKKTRRELDKGTEKMMRNTPKDANGKYPWEQ
ncbi:hypothetical protein D1831_13680 [Lactiplantibacillus garii]|uniref:Uncharacterized protein n=1 Tax=Lactiplantibacillus garii TaxID=2306423 RepID=A0A3R8J508_9LACO|nr:hypothetical protein [Lactiplantibacillus garii]RRK09261.1 hypothetical protein D1831_13680 [Lactiplantibacillus garii]